MTTRRPGSSSAKAHRILPDDSFNAGRDTFRSKPSDLHYRTAGEAAPLEVADGDARYPHADVGSVRYAAEARTAPPRQAVQINGGSGNLGVGDQPAIRSNQAVGDRRRKTEVRR